MKEQQYFIYIATNKSYTLYIGVTNDIARRMEEHKMKSVPGFTSRYNIDRLIYCEVFDNPENAIAREKELKGWTRQKKIALIKTQNPEFKDLAEIL